MVLNGFGCCDIGCMTLVVAGRLVWAALHCPHQRWRPWQWQETYVAWSFVECWCSHFCWILLGTTSEWSSDPYWFHKGFPWMIPAVWINFQWFESSKSQVKQSSLNFKRWAESWKVRREDSKDQTIFQLLTVLLALIQWVKKGEVLICAGLKMNWELNLP